MADQPPPNKAPGSSGWRNPRSADAARDTAGSKRRFWLTFLIGTFLALGTVLAVWMLVLKPGMPDAVFLAINIGDYNARAYPSIAFANSDGERLSRHFEEKTIAQTKTKKLLLEELSKLAERSDRPVVVQLTALALVHEDKVYVLPADADPDDRSRWVLVDDVLEAVGRSKGPRLLILDLAHPLADARLGVLSDRVAETLENQLRKNPPAFFVLCSCLAGQFSWRSEILQGSALAYYLDRAFLGEADGLGGGHEDKFITVKELFAYLEPRVDRWAQAQRRQRQQPLLLGGGEDFRVLNLNRRFIPAEHKAEPPGYADAHKKGWELRDAWHAQRVHEYAARLYYSLEGQLLRQEERWRGGVDRADNEKETQQLMASAVRGLAKIHNPMLPAYTLAAIVPDSKRSLDLARRIEGILVKAKAPEKSVEKKDEKKEDLVKAAAKLFEEHKDFEFPQRAWAVIEALGRRTPLLEHEVRLAAEIVEPGKPGQTFVETTYLRRLVEFADGLRPGEGKWPPSLAQQLLRTMHARETVMIALAEEPALLPWIAPKIEEADVDRHKGEKAFLWEEPAGWARAEKTLLDVQQRYERLLRSLRMLQASRRAWNEAFALLSGYRPLLTDWPDEDREATAAWRNAAATAGTLNTFFAVASEDANWGKLGLIETEGTQLEKHLQTLKDVFRKRIQRAQTGSGAEAVEQILCLLKSPLPTAKERVALSDKANQLGKALQSRLEEADFRPEAVRQAPSRAPIRAQLAIDLLALAGIENVKPDELRNAWGKRVFDEWQTAPTASRADLISRIAPPLETGFGPLQKHPTYRLRNQQWSEYLTWLAARYRRESQFLATADGKETREVSDFYDSAAREYLRLIPIE